MNEHPTAVSAVSVGGLIGVAHFMHMIEPILADLSYLAAIIVAGVTVYCKLRKNS